jgi:hypothetical protein
VLWVPFQQGVNLQQVSTTSVDVANSVNYDWTFESTTVGNNIELWHGSELAATSSVLPGTNLL